MVLRELQSAVVQDEQSSALGKELRVPGVIPPVWNRPWAPLPAAHKLKEAPPGK